MSERTAIYRLYDAADVLLYIGRSRRPPTMRFGEHKKAKPWWPQVVRRELTWYDSGAEAFDEERRAILAENPIHNIERHAVRVFTPCQPVWQPLPPGLGKRLAAAARQRDDEKVGEFAYEALSGGVQPSSVARATEMSYEKIARLADRHVARNPDLPPVPKRDRTPRRERQAAT